ncbi:tRNA preQ1(34) S-adenosylmethionine ribosyltransferase-isomerase QueA [Acidiferrimicrobium sp. IK]|uniref:tRNA preQ1(34) S-adenosylmethionine ribosyltransferase-isomerase QueA n=1 Tax=Acidiferrimicrobium sp. IK TaxID=2871700 RepID=UPI0021CB3B03|nr:tRNA preQ1(34) S-adenosylmethionine ribosyltransferase-isomerase QueA [Acidiferrimicrobium sp. IK]
MDVPDYDLPSEAIAQEPSAQRDAARLLVSMAEGDIDHRHVRDLPDLLEPGDVLVVNTTRVLPARLRLEKATGGAAEVLLLEPVPGTPGCWEALVRPGRRLPAGTVLSAPDGGRALVEVGEELGEGRRQVRLLAEPHDVFAAGVMPVPPYIEAVPADPERYQTVYAEQPGSVAAPTAGLHLTHQVLDECRARGVEVAAVDLAVGLGTFLPVTATRAEDHVMHAERYHVPEATMAACEAARRVVAVGTTTVRALESAAATGERSGRSTLYIRGDYPWRVVDVLMTNFHQPRSTLLLLLESFVGPRWRDLYAEALRSGYRFLSFGDAMLVGRARGGERMPV